MVSSVRMSWRRRKSLFTKNLTRERAKTEPLCKSASYLIPWSYQAPYKEGKQEEQGWHFYILLLLNFLDVSNAYKGLSLTKGWSATNLNYVQEHESLTYRRTTQQNNERPVVVTRILRAIHHTSTHMYNTKFKLILALQICIIKSHTSYICTVCKSWSALHTHTTTDNSYSSKCAVGGTNGELMGLSRP